MKNIMPGLRDMTASMSDDWRAAREREPARQSMITGAQNTVRAALSTDNTDATARRAARTAKSAYMDVARTTPGSTSGWMKAAQNAAANAAAEASNDVYLQSNELGNLLQKKGSLIDNLLSLDQLRAQSPADGKAAQMMQLMSMLTNTIYGQPQVPVGQGLGDLLGNLAGTFIGGSKGTPAPAAVAPAAAAPSGGLSFLDYFNQPTLNMNSMSRGEAPTMRTVMQAAPLNQFDPTRSLFSSPMFGGTLGSEAPRLRYW